MAVSEREWAALHAGLLDAIRAHDARVGQTAADYAALIRAAVRRASGGLSGEAEQYLVDYIDAVEGLVREGIERAVAPVAGVASALAVEQIGRGRLSDLSRLAVRAGSGMRDAWIAERVTDAYTRRWPDGLRLSDRVWAWGAETRRGVSDALAAGVRLERTSGRIVSDMQRAIEASAGERFAIATRQRADWLADLASEGRRAVGDPRLMSSWLDTLKRARAHVDSLADGGTRRQARVALEGVREAILAGRADLLDQRLRWWVYDRQLFAVRRVVRTEMSTAYHRAVLAVGDADSDVLGYVWRLSASHPRPDICDFYANIDLGMGRGVWPRDQAPPEKAHPHCMCSLTPTTRPMRRDGQRGNVSVGQFLDSAPRRTLEQMVPTWAREAHAAGVPWERLTRPDGVWLMSREEARAAGVLPDAGGDQPDGAAGGL